MSDQQTSLIHSGQAILGQLKSYWAGVRSAKGSHILIQINFSLKFSKYNLKSGYISNYRAEFF